MRAVGAAAVVGMGLGLGSAPAQAQDVSGFSLGQPVLPQTAIVTLDQERLFEESAYGRRVAREIETALAMLATENRGLEAALAAEERELTERRPSLAPDAFRALADAFDARVVETRRTQDSKARALTRRADLEREAFLGRVLPILAEIVEARGAVAILDERAVFLAAESIDITGEAVARIDTELGDGADLPPVRAPTPE